MLLSFVVKNLTKIINFTVCAFQTVVLQPISLTLTRNDFMMETRSRSDGTKGQEAKQVEFNTFASGAGGVIGGMTDVHR